MFKTLVDHGRVMGFTVERGEHFFFFGSRHMAREDLSAFFPSYRFSFLKQVHGKAIAEAHEGVVPEADAHYTHEVGRALVIQSADCLPLLLAGTSGVCAIHAGWRGIALNLIGAAAKSIPAFAPQIAVLGPHIGFDSFEVDLDVCETLLNASSHKEGLSRPGRPGKFYFDLAAMASQQLHAAFPKTYLFANSQVDTVTSADHHSFRRDRQRAGRQFSFVVINSAKPV